MMQEVHKDRIEGQSEVRTERFCCDRERAECRQKERDLKQDFRQREMQGWRQLKKQLYDGGQAHWKKQTEKCVNRGKMIKGLCEERAEMSERAGDTLKFSSSILTTAVTAYSSTRPKWQMATASCHLDWGECV